MSRQKHKPDPKQLEFDYPRGKRKEWLDKIVIPDFSYLNSRGTEIRVRDTTKMILILRCVENHTGSYEAGSEDPGCRLKLSTIAREICTKVRKEGKSLSVDGLDTTTASRAIAACEKAGLLEVARQFYKHQATFYRINWFRVKEFILANPDTEALINKADPIRNSAEVDPLQQPNHPLQVAVDPLQLAVHPLQVAVDPLQLAVDDTLYPHTRGLNPCINHEINHQRNHVPQPGDFGYARHGDDFDFAGYAGWPYKLEREHLKDSFKVQQLWEYALSKGFGGVRPGDRNKFFALVWCATQPRIKRPGGYLTSTLRKIADGESTWPTDVGAVKAAINATSKVDVTKEHLKSGKLTDDARRLLAMYQSKMTKADK